MSTGEFVVIQVWRESDINAGWQDYSRCTAAQAIEHVERNADVSKWRAVHWISKDRLNDRQLRTMADADALGAQWETKAPPSYDWDYILSQAEDVPGNDGRWKRAVIELAEGETAYHPGSSKHVLNGPGVLRYQIHPSGVLADWVNKD